MNPKQVTILGMELDEWKHKSCTAHFGVGDDWATLYDIASEEGGKGHGSALLKQAKEHYEGQGKRVRSTAALNRAMEHLLRKLSISEYV